MVHPICNQFKIDMSCKQRITTDNVADENVKLRFWPAVKVYFISNIIGFVSFD